MREARAQSTLLCRECFFEVFTNGSSLSADAPFMMLYVDLDLRGGSDEGING